MVLVVIEELKQRVKAKAAKIKKYEERNNQFLQNRLFQTNRKRLFEKSMERKGITRSNQMQSRVKHSGVTFGV